MKHLVFKPSTSTSSSPLKLAEVELTRWLSAACPDADFGSTKSLGRAGIVLGTFEDLTSLLEEAPANDVWVDEIIVRTVDGKLVLAGSNPRSVLFAVYTYLESLGFAWLAPGEEGHIIPRLSSVPLEGFDLLHRASLLLRGFGLAGAYDVNQGLQFIEWMARNRFNYLFLEGHSGRSYYEQALGRRLTLAEAKRYDRQLQRAARERGLIFESVGHGWTAWTLGFAPGYSRRKEFVLSDAVRAMAAEVNGVREVFQGSPGNTHLCLSNPEAHGRMTELVCRFAVKHREIDVLAVWLADGINNWCECSACAQTHPSDLWVRLINRLAPAVYEVRPDLKMEVLGYSALVEPPPTERIDNSRGNVILMYAPFIRCYLHTLHDPECLNDWPHHRFPPANNWRFPMNRQYAEYFSQWRDGFEGTNYVFDYYCWLPIKRDIFEGNVPETLCRDLTAYPSLGITGCIDCSRAQSFWPTPLARWMQARASWDADVDYHEERHRLLELAYGEHAALVDEYLANTYLYLLPDHHGRAEERAFCEDKVRRYQEWLPSMRQKLNEAVAASAGVQNKWLQRVAIHADFTALQLDCLLAEGAGDYDRAGELARALHRLATSHAPVLAGVADPAELRWLEKDTLERLEAKKAGTYERIG